MEKYIVFSRWTDAAGPIPDETRRGWEAVYANVRPNRLFDSKDEAELFATDHREHFMPGMIVTHVAKLELPE